MGIKDLVGRLQGLASGVTTATLVEPAELAQYRRQIPQDIIELLWFADGPMRNYTYKPDFESSSAVGGVRMTVSFFGASDPSAMSVSFSVAAPRNSLSVQPLGYYPSYEGMTAEQRWRYLNWLVDIDQPVDIGYVFVFYYGLERHLFSDHADRAVATILRLRAHHRHKSFVHYSSNAIIAASLASNRPDWLMQFAQSLGGPEDVTLSDVYLYAKSIYGFALSASEVIAMASRVGFTNRRYIKNEPELFEAAVGTVLQEKYGDAGLVLSAYPIASCSESKYPLFANVSLDRDGELLRVPAIGDVPRLQKDVLAVLLMAHEAVKQELKELRATSRTTGRQDSAG